MISKKHFTRQKKNMPLVNAHLTRFKTSCIAITINKTLKALTCIAQCGGTGCKTLLYEARTRKYKH